jgi:hypothetical protein
VKGAHFAIGRQGGEFAGDDEALDAIAAA